MTHVYTDILSSYGSFTIYVDKMRGKGVGVYLMSTKRGHAGSCKVNVDINERN